MPDDGQWVEDFFTPLADAGQQPKNEVPRIYTRTFGRHDYTMNAFDDSAPRRETVSGGYYLSDSVSFGGHP